jgi:uncharacterized membrane protein YeaQ/YmgE (transglycosylase-associated protein family)
MSIVELLVLLFIAAVIGYLGQSMGGGHRGGLLIAIFIGFLGAFLGSWLARQLGLPEILTINVGGVQFPVVWAIIGAALLVALFNLGGRRGYWSVTPPTRWVLTVSVLLALLSVLVTTGTVAISVSAYTLMAVAFLLLLMGVMVKGM